MGGSWAIAALNIGAATCPIIAAAAPRSAHFDRCG
jgi:hypothetical protein